MKNTDNRHKIIDYIRSEFIGPDPVLGNVQSNGEEILCFEPPRLRYGAGILFPKDVEHGTKEELTKDEISASEKRMEEQYEEKETDEIIDFPSKQWEMKNEDGDTTNDELINLSNSFHQSAISLTASLKLPLKDLSVKVHAAKYVYEKIAPKEAENSRPRYLRVPIESQITIRKAEIENMSNNTLVKEVRLDEEKTNLLFIVTRRTHKLQGKLGIVVTFTLLNQNVMEKEKTIKDQDCYFQAGFKVNSLDGTGCFSPLPESKQISKDEDIKTNRLLYRKVKRYALGHGCSAGWNDLNKKDSSKIWSDFLPLYEVKPIVPSKFKDIKLEMLEMSDIGNFEETVINLEKLCSKYESWIKEEQNNIRDELNGEMIDTAERHIQSCIECLERMKDGVNLLKTDEMIKKAFGWMNRAMLMQQLHYNMPLRKWINNSDSTLTIDDFKMPDLGERKTWPDNGTGKLGNWRPFQIAFIIMNLRSMTYKEDLQRKIVDLIWFPTGGGKTEAYFGLSAFTIFLRRLKDQNDSGTCILMRYTLRLLTTQQYERASSLICAIEKIRSEKEKELGNKRISIGLWVGKSLTRNKRGDAVNTFKKLNKGETSENPFLMLKCPWCGAQMGPIKLENKRSVDIRGYRIERNPSRIVYQCSDLNCDFSDDNFRLPLMVVDEDIYEESPSIIIGTVDKFAMLPWRSEARSIFGYRDDKNVSPPELIVQDELHLISGPLGSMVGHYETLIYRLCTDNNGKEPVFPKIIASTATISHASEQCNLLYNCGEENVFQFPPPGLEAGKSFFAQVDKNAKGRLYCGVMAPAASSIAMAAIQLFATLLFAVKDLKVDDEKDRNPYWTNIGYFNSLRELGQAASWINADISEYLHGIYKRRMMDKLPDYKNIRRYRIICEELTSRKKDQEIPEVMKKLEVNYPERAVDTGFKDYPIDICLATNMISVGVDIQRLGLMTVMGQPKTNTEYIQATSRIGRSEESSGLVFVLLNPAKPRDRSHFEQFVSYHSRLYYNVEPTSVTPFAAPVRSRALHALLVGMVRFFGNPENVDNPNIMPSKKLLDNIMDYILDRVQSIDPDEVSHTKERLQEKIDDWNRWRPTIYGDFSSGDSTPLMYPHGSTPNPKWGDRGWPTPTSMRNVDAECNAKVISNYSSDLKEGE